MAVCLALPSCSAVDSGPQGCVLHNNVDDLMTAYNAPGITQFVLNRHCLLTTPQPTSGRATIPAKNYTVPIGISTNIKSCYYFF